MDRYTAAQMGQNISSIGDAFMQINDPRRRAEAEALRAGIEGQRAQTAGLLLKNQYSPALYTSQIGQNNAAAGAQNAHAGLYQEQAAGHRTRNAASRQLMSGIGGAFAPVSSYDPTNPPLPVYTPADATDQDLELLLPALGNNPIPGPEIALPDGVVPAVPQTAGISQAFSPLDLAILASVQSGGDASDMATGTAQAMGMSANDELTARRALLGQGKVMGQGEYFMPANSDAYQGREIAGAFARTHLQEQGANVRKSADIIAGGGGRSSSSTGSSGGSGKNPLDAVNGAELTAKLSAQRFGLAGETGEPAIDPTMRPAAIAWEASVTNLAEQGVPIQTAISIADQHHNISGISRAGDGWFDGAPRMETGKDFNPASITPEEAGSYGASYIRPSSQSSSGGAERMFAAGMLNPAIAEMASQVQVPPVEQRAAPAIIPPLLQRPSDPVPSTGEKKASDAFKPREGSAEKKSREAKEKRAKELKSEIDKLSKELREGKTKVQPVAMVGGGYAGPLVTNISNDGFNERLQKLKKMEDELAGLTAHPTSQPPTQTIEDRLSKYR